MNDDSKSLFDNRRIGLSDLPLSCWQQDWGAALQGSVAAVIIPCNLQLTSSPQQLTRKGRASHQPGTASAPLFTHRNIYKLTWVTALIAGRNENQAQGGWARSTLIIRTYCSRHATRWGITDLSRSFFNSVMLHYVIFDISFESIIEIERF